MKKTQQLVQLYHVALKNVNTDKHIMHTVYLILSLFCYDINN